MKFNSIVVAVIASLSFAGCTNGASDLQAGEPVGSDDAALSSYTSTTPPPATAPEACYWHADPSMPATPTAVRNGNFAAVGPAQALINYVFGPYTGATDWTLYNNTMGESFSTVVDSAPADFARGGNRHAMFVSAGGNANGLVQVMAPYAAVTGCYDLRVRANVITGKISTTLANAGCGGDDNGLSRVADNGSWVTITSHGRADRANNEINIYAVGGPAAFYVSDVRLTPCKLDPSDK